MGCNVLKMMLATVVLALAAPNVVLAQDHAAGDRLMGEWLTEGGKAKVKVFRTRSNTYVGKIIWLKTPNDEHGHPKVDRNNPDESLRAAPLVGKYVLLNFTYAGDDSWESGTIYDPESGSTYSCTIKMLSNYKLEVRGYVGVEMFGRTSYWTR